MTVPVKSKLPVSPAFVRRILDASTNAGRVGSRFLFGIAFAAILLSIGIACGESQQKEIRIGLIAPITGAIPIVGESSVNAANLAVDQINEAGGLNVDGEQYQVVLLVEDNQDNGEISASKTIILANERSANAIVGPQASRNAIPASDAAELAQIPMVSPWSSNPETTLGKKWVFRAAYIDPVQAPLLASFVIEQLRSETAAVLYDVTSAYNSGLADNFKSSFEGRGGTVVAFETYTTDALDFTEQLARIKESGAEVLFLPNYYQEVPEQVRQARFAGIDAQLLGADAWSTILENDRDVLDGAFFTTQYAPGPIDPIAQRFIVDYRDAFGKEPDDVAALTFDSFGLVFEAVKNQGKVNSAAIRDGLASIQSYHGVTGSFQFDGVTGDPIKSVFLMKIEKGEFIFNSRLNR